MNLSLERPVVFDPTVVAPTCSTKRTITVPVSIDSRPRQNPKLLIMMVGSRKTQ